MHKVTAQLNSHTKVRTACAQASRLSHASQRAVALLLALMLCLTATALSGCRYSETLLETIVDPINGVLEPDSTPEYREAEGAPENPSLASVKLTDNENLADQENFLPVYKEDAEANGEAYQRIHAENVDDSTDASEGTDLDEENTQEQTSAGDQTQQEQSDSAQDGDTGKEQTGDGNDSQADDTAGRGGTGKVYGDGTYEELPEATALAAKGQYALITQMLAGEGGLGGADATWLAKIQATGAFPDEGLENVPAVWDEEGTLDIDALIASDADALLVDGVDVVLTQEESDQITAAGIDIVSVPVLGQTYTSDSDITTAVKVVGQLLANYASKATYSTADMVERYLTQHDTAIEGCLNANGGYSYKMVAGYAYQGIYQGTSATGEPTTRLSNVRITTACIDSWTQAASNAFTANRSFSSGTLYLDGQTIDTSDGVGLSATALAGSFVLSDYYLQVAGVVNNAYDSARPSSTDGASGLTLPYAVIPGDDKGLTARSLGTRQVPSALWYPTDGVTYGSQWNTVGDADFPAVITRSSDITSSVATSAAKANGLYNVGQSYEIYTVPEGLAGSWLDGTVESYLLSLWAYGMFQEGGTTGTVSEWIDGFYKLFYRVDGASSSGLVAGLGEVAQATCPTR